MTANKEPIKASSQHVFLIICWTFFFKKEEVSRKFDVISKPQKCLSVSRNKEIIVKFVINYHPSTIKLSISASRQRQNWPVWIET